MNSRISPLYDRESTPNTTTIYLFLNQSRRGSLQLNPESLLLLLRRGVNYHRYVSPSER
uniref:Uncharacterized protein n=1 Tax=Picea glauca TaxID=3330 RepID=A0A117NFW5_PICGL|nr:hypothetical protein ABT39_MTgene2257 [Picea glauca]